MQPQAEARDPRRLVEEPSPFRDAFARARLESFGMGAVTEPTAGRPMFEVRIEKRRGKRAVDAARWNLLGQDGWELVAVRKKHAYFRRALR
jgi:hypothetical protein